MPETIKIFASKSLDDDKQLSGLLCRLEGVELVEVPEARLLVDRVPLPFVETANGWRYVGIEAIKQFVLDQTRNGGK